MSNLELRIEEEASLNLTFGESSDMSFSAVDFVGVPFAPTVEVEDIEGGHRVSITSMGAEGKKTDEFDVMDGADGATGPQGPEGDSYEITASDYAEIAKVVEEDIQDVIDAAQDAASDATAAAAEARAASAATWLSGNVLFGELAEGTVLTADDAYAAPPKGVSVYGVSTQDGTPTPDAPVAIQSVDDLTLYVCGKNLLPKSGTDSKVIRGMTNYTDGSGTITISGTFQSIPPDVSTSYGASGLGTSANYYEYAAIEERNAFYLPAGTYTFSATVTDRVGEGQAVLVIGNIGQTAMTGAFNRRIASGTAPQTFTTTGGLAMLIVGTPGKSIATVDITISNIQLEVGTTATAYTPYIGTTIPIPLSDHIARSLPDGTRDTVTLTYQGPSTEHEGWGVFGMTLQQLIGSTTTAATDGITGTVGVDVLSTTGEIADGPTVIYKLATPVIHDLGTIELPVNPAPDLTVWADGGSAQPTMALSYEQDINIVIGELRSAIADMATS